jgi:hypothetical protein
MKNRLLTLQGVIFTTSCYGLGLLLVLAMRFPIGRLFLSIFMVLIFVAAEILSGYVVLRQLWRWSAKAAHALLGKQQERLTSVCSNDDDGVRPTARTSESRP